MECPIFTLNSHLISIYFKKVYFILIIKKNLNSFFEEVVGCEMEFNQGRKKMDKRNISKVDLRESTCPLTVKSQKELRH